jgi:hypothetical protein
VKAVAVLVAHRIAAIPDVPASGEQGVAGVEASVWNAFFLPKGASDAIVRKLNAAINRSLESPALRQRLEELGIEIVPPERRTPEYLARFLPEEIERWAKPIRAAGSARIDALSLARLTHSLDPSNNSSRARCLRSGTSDPDRRAVVFLGRNEQTSGLGRHIVRQRLHVAVTEIESRVGHGSDTGTDACTGFEITQSLEQNILALAGQSGHRSDPGKVIAMTGFAAVLHSKLCTNLRQFVRTLRPAAVWVAAARRNRRRDCGFSRWREIARSAALSRSFDCHCGRTRAAIG